ncbi:MAG TPA: hypothetical protein VMV54_08135, partial [Acidocella sp.]|nr:hypothetical protein [Acidocella sp.]
MGTQERRAYLEAIQTRYRRARKTGKTIFLDEFCAVCGYPQICAARAAHRRLPQQIGHTQARPDLTELVEALRTI